MKKRAKWKQLQQPQPQLERRWPRRLQRPPLRPLSLRHSAREKTHTEQKRGKKVGTFFTRIFSGFLLGWRLEAENFWSGWSQIQLEFVCSLINAHVIDFCWCYALPSFPILSSHWTFSSCSSCRENDIEMRYASTARLSILECLINVWIHLLTSFTILRILLTCMVSIN